MLKRKIRKTYREFRKRRETDVYVLSFPKCGRTWLRMLLGQAIQSHFGRTDQDPTEIYKITRRIENMPTIRFTHDDDPQWKRPAEIGRSKRRYRDKRVVFLVRDPRDAVVSNYFQKRFRDFGNKAFDGTLSEFVRTDVGGLHSLVTFYNVWAEAKDNPKDFLLMRYEKLHEDTHRELARLLDFVGLQEQDEDLIERAVEASSFENMRKMEASKSLSKNRMRPKDESDPRSYKMRKGKVGGYRDQLSDDDIEYIDSVIKEHLDPLYEWYFPGSQE